jgi:hypothetical protein
VRIRASAVVLVGLSGAVLELVGCGGGSGGTGGPDDATVARLGLTRELPPRLLSACDRAARLTALEVVYCPPVVPAGPVAEVQFVDVFQQSFRVGRKFRHRPVGRSYRVHLVSPSLHDPESGGHWAFEAGPPKDIHSVLHALTGIPGTGREKDLAVKSTRSVTLAGVNAEVLHMARYPQGGIHGGHVVVRWNMRGTDYLISVHGYQNEERALAMADGLISLIRACPAGASDDDHDCSAAISGASPASAQQLATGAAVAKCQYALLGQGDPNWRDHATYVGPVGFYGPERDFRRVVGHRAKTPVFVEGRRAVTLTIDPADRDHAGLEFVGGQRAYAEVRFVPCKYRERTAWPAGFRLRGTEPVGVIVRVGDGPVQRMEVGRP